MLAFVPSRRLQMLIWAVTCVCMSILPTINHYKGGHNKDYPLWYQTGQKVMVNGSLPPSLIALPMAPDGRLVIYPTDEAFPFMYPPFAGVVLGILSLLGPHPFFFALLFLNALSLAVAVELSIWLATGTTRVSLALRLIPSALCIFFLNDMFFLGQPNLGLLALMIGGLALLQTRGRSREPSGTLGNHVNMSHSARGTYHETIREFAAGALFAAAAALKAYPAVAIVYLLWRRNWIAAASMIVFTAAFLVLVPAPIRGFNRNLEELRTWADGMLFRQGSDGIGQRPEQSQSWQNQSIFGVGHRLLRKVDGDIAHVGIDTDRHQPLYVNLLDVNYKTASLAIVAVAGVLGIGFILVMPPRNRRTRVTDASEFAMLVILITVGTPYAYTYYAMWMLYPYTVLVYRGLNDPDVKVRKVCWYAIVISAIWYLIGVPIFNDHTMQAIGSMFWAEMTLLAALAWLILRDRRCENAPVA